MRRYEGVVVLCGLLAVPALVLARAPAPHRPDLDAEESAAIAEELLVKQYGADAKGLKGAKVKFVFQVTEPYAKSENGKSQDLFAIAAAEVSYSGDGLVTLKDARYVEYHYCPEVVMGEKFTGWTGSNSEPAVLRFRFAGPIRRLQDVHKARLKYLEIGNSHLGFEDAHVELIVKKIPDWLSVTRKAGGKFSVK